MSKHSVISVMRLWLQSPFHQPDYTRYFCRARVYPDTKDSFPAVAIARDRMIYKVWLPYGKEPHELAYPLDHML